MLKLCACHFITRNRKNFILLEALHRKITKADFLWWFLIPCSGWTVCHCAAASGSLEILQFLVNDCQVKDTRAKSSNGETLLFNSNTPHCLLTMLKSQQLAHVLNSCRSRSLAIMVIIYSKVNLHHHKLAGSVLKRWNIMEERLL